MARHPFYRPDFAVKIEGLTLAADVRNATRSLSYDNNIDTADMFTLQLDNAGLRFCDSALFDVGKDVEIYMGYEGELHPMMLGEITAINPWRSGPTMLNLLFMEFPLTWRRPRVPVRLQAGMKAFPKSASLSILPSPVHPAL